MKKKLLIYILSIAVLVGVVAYVTAIFAPKLDETVMIRGYEIKIPKNWSSDSKGNLYDRKGGLVGTFTLIDDETKVPDLDGTELTKVIKKQDDFLFDSIPATIYYADNLPNPEPYGAELILFDNYVNGRLADKIAKTFKIPETGTNPPQKNIALPDLDSAVIKIEFSDKSTSVKNTKLLVDFAEKYENKENAGINILTYEEKDGKREISEWKYLESDSGKGYAYTYYKADDGTYTYDNNPLIFGKIFKKVYDEDEKTVYLIKLETEETVKLLEFPLNRYRDNAKELIALKTDDAKSADVENILSRILSKKEYENTTFKLSNGAIIISVKNVNITEPKARSHASVLFALLENVESITFSVDGAEYKFSKNQTAEIPRDAIEDEKTFIDYTEKIEEETSKDGEIVYSGTITISYNTQVTHPETGKKVSVGPYAEKRGYGAYLGKPITCVIKRSGNAYIASASSNGKHIMSYPLENEERLNWAISLIKAYS